MDLQNRPRSKVSGQKMISEFSNKPTLMWVGVALGIHVVVICAIGLAWQAKERAALAAKASENNPSITSPTPSSSAAAPGRAETDEEKALRLHKDSAVVKSITDTATSGETPAEPGRSGLELGDDLPKPRK